MFDLFGTLVNAPTPAERTQAASRLSEAIDCPSRAVEGYLRSTWHVRHDGTLPTVSELAEHLLRAVGGRARAHGRVENELRALGRTRLEPDATVVRTLNRLRGNGLRLGVVSDATAEIADTWRVSPLSAAIDVVLFSCTAGHTKPDQRLYSRICGKLGVLAPHTWYVGDGGGDELNGALAAGMTAIAVRRRGSPDGLAFGVAPWSGPAIDGVEQLPARLVGNR
ncbi:FMN phosphatase YigB (HAD superfamily) [Micromonospora sp. Llam0]|uniref:HAD family hydrolase n=1 Tax=Micromonospora sp. Llam0 TaxID=2485143 RepID=UPI000FB2E97B|nr:HAD family hydrolase [Micromonospora sp. Llam0]ROO62170.1 FMN phosphatase YigB (HAD superfamily) [Micromonospora sp. Llam0]